VAIVASFILIRKIAASHGGRESWVPLQTVQARPPSWGMAAAGLQQQVVVVVVLDVGEKCSTWMKSSGPPRSNPNCIGCPWWKTRSVRNGHGGRRTLAGVWMLVGGLSMTQGEMMTAVHEDETIIGGMGKVVTAADTHRVVVAGGEGRFRHTIDSLLIILKMVGGKAYWW